MKIALNSLKVQDRNNLFYCEPVIFIVFKSRKTIMRKDCSGTTWGNWCRTWDMQRAFTSYRKQTTLL